VEGTQSTTPAAPPARPPTEPPADPQVHSVDGNAKPAYQGSDGTVYVMPCISDSETPSQGRFHVAMANADSGARSTARTYLSALTREEDYYEPTYPDEGNIHLEEVMDPPAPFTMVRKKSNKKNSKN
jgi:hypothetical protein